MSERIIDEAVLQGIQRTCYEAGRSGREAFTVRGAGEEIVRCRDCKHLKERKTRPEHVCDFGVEHWGTEPDGFCSWGERREP